MNIYRPLRSLREGHWFKLICGASFHHLPAVRNLTLAYALAGADCIDVAADVAVVTAVREALQVAKSLSASAPDRASGYTGSPWLMVSLNDGVDPHFRKAEFSAADCPVDCHRPCESICPAQAIIFNEESDEPSGVVADRCYGCGRCIPICPFQRISTCSHSFIPEITAAAVLPLVDAIEIHTQVGRLEAFQSLWQAIVPWVDSLKLVAISCPDGEGLIEYLRSLYEIISPLVGVVVWQTDGRPMSGDIGDGTTHAAIKLGQKVLAAGLPGYVQLAGGTNRYTVEKLKALGLLTEIPIVHAPQSKSSSHRCQPPNRSSSALQSFPSTSYIAGVAYGSYARVLLSPVLELLEQGVTMLHDRPVSPFLQPTLMHLETFPELLWQAVDLASSLVSPLKVSR